MNTIKKDVVFGLLAAYVPIILLSNGFGKNCVVDNLVYTDMIKTLPILFVVVNVLGMMIMRFLGINNYFIIGAILSVVYSGIGRYAGIPQKIFKMDPNTFQQNAVVLWALFYGLVENLLIK